MKKDEMVLEKYKDEIEKFINKLLKYKKLEKRMDYLEQNFNIVNYDEEDEEIVSYEEGIVIDYIVEYILD